MKTNDIAGADRKSTDREKNKAGLARHYSVGVRTIENWLHWRIIAGRMARGEIVFDVADCDMRLLKHRNQGREGNLQNSETKRDV
ncbi:MAG: hypothetical protein NT154_38340 [Verrucomicrobia bacterium]|nr:hypothetical protein [Verrucomicrobiota bacterium]